MNKLLVKGGLVVTVDPENRVFRNGSIYVEDNVIKEVGPATEVGDKEGAEVIDASGKVVVPGFVSCHNHLYSSVVRSIPASGFDNVDYSFISWMERFWLPLLEDRVTQEQMYVGTLANMIEHIRSGMTTTSDTAEGSYALPGALDFVDRAAMESGMRAVLSFETTGRISEDNARLGLEENVKFFKRAKERGGRVTGRIGVHTTFTCSTELLQEVRAVADEIGAGVIPAGSGTKEMVRRLVNPAVRTKDVEPLPILQRLFEQIGLGKVATSAEEARQFGILGPADRVVMNRDMLIAEAKREALHMVESGYQPPVPEKIYAAGRDHFAAMKVGLYMMKEGGYITEHEAKIAEKLAYVLTGGEISRSTWMDEQYFLDLEREAFLSLCGEEKTQERMWNLLNTGKVLRN